MSYQFAYQLKVTFCSSNKTEQQLKRNWHKKPVRSIKGYNWTRLKNIGPNNFVGLNTHIISSNKKANSIRSSAIPLCWNLHFWYLWSRNVIMLWCIMYQTGASRLQTVYKFIVAKTANKKCEALKGQSKVFWSAMYIMVPKHTNLKNFVSYMKRIIPQRWSKVALYCEWRCQHSITSHIAVRYSTFHLI